MSTIGDKLKSERLNRNLTQSEMADLLSLKRSTYSLYESGKREPKLKQLRKIADILNIYIGDLVEDWSSFAIDEINEDLNDADIVRLYNNYKLNYFGEFLRVNNIKFTVCKKNDVSGKIFSLNDGHNFKYFLTDEQARMLPEMTIEQVKSLIRSLDQLNNEDLFSE